jgi:glycerol kinase
MGMTQYTTKAHIVRAALEGIGYQTREVIFYFVFFLF